MNVIQEKLLLLARTVDLDKTKKVDLVEMIGCEYSSQVSHHLGQLIKRGDLVRTNGRLVPALKTNASIIDIPVLGEADCGEATKYADGRLIERLRVSPSMIEAKNYSNLYALIARGDSMNAAVVRGKYIENGDFVIVEKKDGYMPNNGDIVVSNIGGLANIKRLHRERDRVVLMPESYKKHEYGPIIIHETDDYSVEGKVVDVVKAVQND